MNKGYSVLEWSYKKDYLPTKKREPVYRFIKRTVDKEDIEKQKIKQLTSDFIREFFISVGAKKIRLLSLPGVTWDFERSLRNRMSANRGQHRRHERIKVSITGCESDYKLFRLSATRMPGHNQDTLKTFFSDNLGHYVVQNTHHMAYLLNADIFDVVNMKNDKGLKYDCIWFDTTNTVISITRKLGDISHIVSENSILIFTLLKGREHIRLGTDRTSYLTNYVSDMGYTLAHEIPYYDTCPMLHLIYQRKQSTP